MSTDPTVPKDFDPEIKDEVLSVGAKDYKKYSELMYNPKKAQEVYELASRLFKDFKQNALPKVPKEYLDENMQLYIDRAEKILNLQNDGPENTLGSLKHIQIQYEQTLQETRNIHKECLNFDEKFQKEFDEAKKKFDEEIAQDD